MAIYMKFGNVLGDVQESKHVNWIELASVVWSVARPGNSSGASDTRVLAAPRITEVTVTKDQDVATIPLLQLALEGGASSVQIDFLRTGPDPMEVYYTIELKKALITGLSQSSAGERPVESVAISFTEIAWSGKQMAPDGRSTSPSSYAWNLPGNAAR